MTFRTNSMGSIFDNGNITAFGKLSHRRHINRCTGKMNRNDESGFC